MKKLIAILMVLSLVLCLAACGKDDAETPGKNSENSGTTDGPVQDSWSFTYNGTSIALHAEAEAVISALGEPVSYSESTSCAFEGLDKTYIYPSFAITTYPIGDKDYISGWWFLDDMVENAEGIAIGDSLADVQAAYSADCYNGTNTYTVKKGSGQLLIILESEIVFSIQYSIITE